MSNNMKPLTEADIEAPDLTKDILEKNKISLPYLAKKLQEALDAKKTHFFQFAGTVTDKRDVIDWGTRERARMDAHKLRGDYPSERLEHSGTIVFESNVPEPDPLPEEEKNE